MADKIIIEIFRSKNAEDFTAAVSEPSSKAELGSVAAMTAAEAAAMTKRCAVLAQESVTGNERLDYIARNAGIVRGYMVHLIDEDIKCRGPIKKALRENRPEREVEACRHPAVCICEEIINMASQLIGFDAELCALVPRETVRFAGASAELAWSAMNTALMFILSIVRECADDTFEYVTRRENEVIFGEAKEQLEAVREKTSSALERA